MITVFIISGVKGNIDREREIDQSATATVVSQSVGDDAVINEDLSNVEKVYTLDTGNYIAGVDIPAGECNVVAVSGTGNLYSSNLYDSGINETFGIDDGSGFYIGTFNGLELPEGETLEISGNLTVQLTYSNIESNFTGRTYDEANAITLSSGNYTAGTDFNAGTYKIVAVSGGGNLHSSNLYSGGVNEMFGVDDGTGDYTEEITNVDLPDGNKLQISGGLSVKLILAIEN